MIDQLTTLRKLQELDLEIGRLTRIQEGIEDKDNGQAAAKTQLAEAKKSEIEKTREKLRAAEQAYKGARLAAKQARCGTASDPESLAQALARERRLSREVKQCKVKLVRLMIELNNINSSGQAALPSAEQGMTAQEAERQRRRIMRQRRELMERIDRGILETYETLRKNRHGIGVVALSNGICPGCFMKLPTKQIARIMTGGTVERCPHCLRIVVPPQAANS